MVRQCAHQAAVNLSTTARWPGCRRAGSEAIVLWVVSLKEANITEVHVPGGFEIPLACSRLLASKKYDAVIALGCVIKGETKHDEYISHSVAHALQSLMLMYNKPVAFGVLTPNTLEQAQARAVTGEGNKGREAATAALAML
jgi:6,7-dimethyl-8-ribityllumazine synthase